MLQAAVTVIWCMSMVMLFVDVVIIIRRFLPPLPGDPARPPGGVLRLRAARRAGHPGGIVATLSGSWTPLISNDQGSVTIAGAHIAYGSWFYLVAGIAVLSLLVAVVLYLVGRRTAHAAKARPIAAA